MKPCDQPPIVQNSTMMFLIVVLATLTSFFTKRGIFEHWRNLLPALTTEASGMVSHRIVRAYMCEFFFSFPENPHSCLSVRLSASIGQAGNSLADSEHEVHSSHCAPHKEAGCFVHFIARIAMSHAVQSKQLALQRCLHSKGASASALNFVPG